MMMGVRIGAVLMARKKGLRISKMRMTDAEELEELAQLNGYDKIQDMDIKENTKTKIVFRKYPFLEWGLALAFFATFSFSELMIHTANLELGNARLQHEWVQLFLLSLLILAGLASLYEGEVETVVLDKQTETLLVKYTSIMCKKRYHCHALKNISGVKGIIRGRKGPTETTHYVLCIYTHSGQMIKTLFSKSEARIKKQLLLIRKFLGIELEKPIQIVDMAQADLEVQTDLKTKIMEHYRELKKPLITG